MLPHSSWFASFTARTRAPRLRLFCFPYAGAGASCYASWGEQLSDEVEVCAVRLPGRENRYREPSYTRLPALVDALLTEIRARLDVRFAFFGHSMGALIAFELTRAMRNALYPTPEALIVSASSAPQLRPALPPVHGLSDHQLIERIRSLQGTPEDVFRIAELRNVILPRLRTDFSLCETYTYTDEPPLNLPILAYGGEDDVHVPPPRLDAWSAQSSRAFVRRNFPGGHFFPWSNNQTLVTLRRALVDMIEIRERAAHPRACHAVVVPRVRGNVR